MELIQSIYHWIWFHKVKCDYCGKTFYRSREVGLEKKNVCSMGCAMGYYNKELEEETRLLTPSTESRLLAPSTE